MVIEHRVFGPPGTGKTTYLSRQIALAAEKRGGEEILVASFTRAAANELVSRDLPVPAENVGTLHAIAYRALNRPTIAEGKVKEFNEAQSVYRLSVSGTKSPEPEDVIEQNWAEEGDRLLNAMNVCRARMLPRERWPLDVQAFAATWERWKDESGYLDFTDLIEFALRDTYEAPGRPSIGFFDEVQDFTALELALVRQWGEAMDYIVLAGDDDQCIYGFKGATPDAFLVPPVDEEHRRVLDQSYRMPAAVHAYSQEWIRNITRRQEKEFNSRPDFGGVAAALDLTLQQPGRLIDHIEEHTAAGLTVMVLTTCGYMLDPILKELRYRGILFHNPYRRNRGDWNPLAASTERTTSTADRLLAFLRFDNTVWAGHGDVRLWSGADLRRWIPLVRVDGVLRRGAKKLIEAILEDEVMTPSRLDELFEPGQWEAAINGGVDWLMEHCLASKEKALAYPATVIQRHGGAALWERPRVIVGTIHSVKGGEADVVYLFPDLSHAGWRDWLGGGRDGIIRQFYVGMSRARELLYVCGASTPMAVPLPVPPPEYRGACL